MRNIPPKLAQQLIRLPEVESLTGCKKTTIYKLMKEGKFPQCIKITRRLAAWTEQSIQDWVDQQIKTATLNWKQETAPAALSTKLTTTPPLPGQYWPEQNGHYAGIMRSADRSSAWHVVVPDAPAKPLLKMPWGKYGQDVPGANCRLDGYANTLAMAEAGSELAKAILALPGDCHLASQAEAALCAATLPNIFPAGYHWTSTQYSRNGAWYQDFEYGGSGAYGKGDEFRAVAVRKIQL